MTIMPPPQGKHHRRHGTHARHSGQTYLTTSDIMWMLGVVVYFAAMVGVAKLMDDGLWVMLGLTGVLLALFIRRFVHQSGDRHRNGLKTTPQEEQEFVARTTGEIPVLTPTALSSEPFAAQAEPVEAQPVSKPRPWWMPTKGQLITFGLATFVMIASEFSEHRAETARMMQNDIDRLLGVPGDWNGYAPTTSTMGIRGWGSYGQQARQDTMPFSAVPGSFLAARQYAALHGYEQDRFSEEGRAKWEGFFR